MQPTSERWIDYLRTGDAPKLESIAEKINTRFPPGPHAEWGVVGESDVSRWRRTIPKDRVEQLGKLVDEQIWKNLSCDPEPVYLCNISETYGRDRERSARRKLRQILRELLPQRIMPGVLAQYIIPTRLPRGVHAQTFANNRHAPSVFIILVEQTRQDRPEPLRLVGAGVGPIALTPIQQEYVLKEYVAHVFNGRTHVHIPLTHK